MLQLQDDFFQRVVGSNLTIEASVFANPPPSVVWTFNGFVIDDSTPKYAISSKSFPETFRTDLALDVTDLQKADGGEYSLNVSNTFGTRVATVLLDVQCKCVLYDSSNLM